MFTASHNPYRYQGIKFIPHYAGPAMPRETDRIGELLRQEMEEEGGGKGAAPVSLQEELLESLRILLENREEYPEDANYGAVFVEGDENNSGMKYSSRGLLEIIEPEGPYLKHLEGIIDRDAIAAAPPFVAGFMHGAGIGYIEAFYFLSVPCGGDPGFAIRFRRRPPRSSRIICISCGVWCWRCRPMRVLPSMVTVIGWGDRRRNT